MKIKIGQRLGLFEILATVVLILLLVGGLVSVTTNNRAAINSLSFDMQQQNFLQNAALIKSQWLLEGRPKQLLFSFFDESESVSNQVLFSMSEMGWPVLVNQTSVTYCRELLAKVTNIPLDNEQRLIFKVTKVQKEDDITCHFCDAGDSEKCFNYSTR